MSLLQSIAYWRPHPPFYYGWLILGMSAMGTYAATGATQLVLGGVQAFIFEDMGWDRRTIAYAVTAGTWTAGFITPIVGRLADRYGPRVLMPIAALIAGLAYFGLARIQTVWHFYAAYIIARAIGNPFLIGVVPRTVAVNFFRRKRNLALGLSAMARPFGGAFNIQIFSLIALAFSWRTAYQVQGAIGLLLVIPLFLIMRRRPSDIGLNPDGDEDPVPSQKTATTKRTQTSPSRRREFNWKAGEAIATSAFWLIVLAEVMVILSYGTISFQVVPYLRDSGVSLAVAAGALSLSSMLGALSNPFWGFLCDRFSPRALALLVTVLSILSVSLFLLVPADTFGFFVVVLYGTAVGGLNILGHMILAQYFGHASFGTITGIVGPFQTVALGFGPTFGALLFGLTGGYTAIFSCGVAAYTLAFLCIFIARPPGLPRRAVAEGFASGD